MRVITRLRYPVVSAGVNATHASSFTNSSVGLTVTDPLQLYRSSLARGVIRPDPAQHRAAIVIQGVYQRLLDYKPPDNFSSRLEKLTNILRSLDQNKGDAAKAAYTTGLQTTWRDNSFLPERLQSPRLQTKSLVKTMSDEEALLELATPQGLMLYGEVGSGKSMLMDMLASSMPYASKQRHHFSAFMLSVYSELELHRTTTALQDTYSLLHVARELIQRSTILFVDEFQFPDRASAMILKHLLSYFFQLGGVLIATSNRLPEDLLATDWRKGEFGVFEEALRRRCQVWDMGSTIDWRRQGEDDGKRVMVPIYGVFENEKPKMKEAIIPQNYFLDTPKTKFYWDEAIKQISAGSEKEWQSSDLLVYSRKLAVPEHKNGVAMFSFHDLCVKPLGPADYITLTSAYPILIIDSVPILTAKSHRHEARRFITLLDAIYETKCKLLIRAAAPIEDLFFPDAEDHSAPSSSDSIDSEAFSEAYQELVNPFRPNISLYEPTLQMQDDELHSSATNRMRKYRSVLADEDSEFNGRTSKAADFTITGKYTGEDEKFAFKRAVSRLWEVCGERWWSVNLDVNMATTPKTHAPLPETLRFWERAIIVHSSTTTTTTNPQASASNEKLGTNQKIDEAPKPNNLFKHGASPYRTHEKAPPKFPPQHMWGVTKWGKRAGKWGQGPDAFKQITDTTSDGAPPAAESMAKDSTSNQKN